MEIKSFCELGTVVHLTLIFSSSSQTVLNRGRGPDVHTGVGTVHLGYRLGI